MSMRTIARSSSNRNSASALVSSVLPTPVGPRNRKLPIGRFGSCKPARARRTALATALQRLLLADHALAQLVLHAQQLVALALQHLVHRHAGPARDHRGDLLLGRPPRSPACRPPPAASFRSRSGISPYSSSEARARSPRRCATSTSLRAWSSCSFSFCALRQLLLLGLPGGGQRVGLLLELGQLLLELVQPVARRRVALLASAPRARSSAACSRRSSSSSSSGLLSTCMRSRLAASSIRSIALSGRKRSVM